MNNAAPVPMSSEMRNIMKSAFSSLDAHSNGEMNNEMNDIEKFVDNWMLKMSMAESVPDEIANWIEVVDHARQINLEANSDDVQELMDSHYQELTIDELIEMHEQEQDIKEFESLDSVH
ncbi:hypothetical protein TNCV_3777331 [Trichonephila clavipes]|nr:hypothetical protein TNCV_3777331 [Trichonephila clavipes]